MKKSVITKAQFPFRQISSFVILSFSIYFFISLITYDQNDPSFSSIYSENQIITNAGGFFGAYISDLFLSIFGASAYILIFFIIHEVYLAIFQKEKFKILILLRFSSIALATLCSCMLFEHFYAGELYPQLSSGGLIGFTSFDFLVSYIGIYGSLVFISIFSIASFTYALQIQWSRLFKYCMSFVQILFTKLKNILLTSVNFFTNAFILISSNIINSIKSFSLDNTVEAEATKTKFREVKEVKSQDTSEEEFSVNTSAHEEQVKPEKIKKKTTVYKKQSDADTSMPNTSLLDKALDDGQSLSKEELNSLADLLEKKLLEFGVEAEVVSVLPGPVVTRFEVQPAPGTKASKITNISQDIARSLAVNSVRVVEVIEGKSVVGVEIPNTNRKMVRLSEILSSEVFKSSSSSLSLALGHDISGDPVVVDLSKMPHLLVAGTTGSGKSVGLNAMLLSLLFKSEPTEVRLILIDPKMLELSVYDGIPHLLTPVITDMTDASNGLRWCVAEMDRRYRLMSEMGVRNLNGLNKLIQEAKNNDSKIFDPTSDDEIELEELPSIVVVVDEFADMMMLVGKKVEHLISRIAQKARAAGIHLILATQRPSVDVITGLIKANIPTRIAFQVSSKIDSRTILDQGGADQLLGYGDMLYLPPGQGNPIRVHGAFVGDDEVHRVVKDWKNKAKPDYLDEITSDLQETGPIPGWTSDSSSNSEENDELYDEAVNFVIESRRASISSVQRKLRIGYNRAARIIEAMEEAGLVSEMGTNGTREVLVPKNQ